MDSHAFIFLDQEEVPEGGRLGFGVVANDNRAFCIEQTLSYQGSLDFFKLGLNLGLYAVDVKILGIRMAGLAGRNVWREAVSGSVTAHVAGNAGVLDCRDVHAGFAFNPTAGADTHQHGCYWAVMRAPMGAVNFDLAIRRGWESAARLVAVGAQVAHAAIEGYAFKGIERHRSGGLERPVITGVAGVDLVAGAAVNPAWIRISGCVIIRIRHSLRDTVTETATGVAGCASVSTACIRGGCTASVKRSGPCDLLAGDQIGVVVAGGAGQISRSRSRSSRTGRPGRPGGPGRTGRAARTGRACAGRQYDGGEQNASEPKNFFVVSSQ